MMAGELINLGAIEDDTLGLIWRNARQSSNVIDRRGFSLYRVSFRLFFPSENYALTTWKIPQVMAEFVMGLGYTVFFLSATPLGGDLFDCVVELSAPRGLSTNDVIRQIGTVLPIVPRGRRDSAQAGRFNFAGDGGFSFDTNSLSSLIDSWLPRSNSDYLQPTTTAPATPSYPAAMSNATATVERPTGMSVTSGVVLVGVGLLIIALVTD